MPSRPQKSTIQKKPSITSLRFDTRGWELKEKSAVELKWEDGKQFLSLHFLRIPPDIPCDLSRLNEVREFYRTRARKMGGGLISCDAFAVKGVPCVQTIFKIPQKDQGMAYVGAVTLPFADFSYVIKVQCIEAGITGMRDSLVLDDLISQGKVKVDPEHRAVVGWSQDPYDPKYKGSVMRNISEDEKYDEQFPDHPLSRCRKLVSHVVSTLEIGGDVMRCAPFRGPKKKNFFEMLFGGEK